MPLFTRPRRGHRFIAAGAGVALAASSLAVLTATPAHAADPVDIQILATNDFHGRLINETSNVAGAAVLSGAVKQLRTENPNTVFAAAGDLIGASTFESFIQHDEPTIAALNEAGLEVSSVGNHEFDQGFADLRDRVQDAADWEYLAANIRLKTDDSHPLAPTWTKDVAGVTVGFVGAVTEDLPSLVSPAGIADIKVTDIVEEVNASAADLVDDGADIVVMLVHEGAPNTTCDLTDDTGTAWSNIVKNVSPDVDAIVSGHTHLAYNCDYPVAQWATDGRAVTKRPVVSAGQYGMNLNQLEYSVDAATGDVAAVTHSILPLESDPDGDGPLGFESNYPADPAVESIVADAVAQADVLGAVELGDIAGAFDRARWSAPDGDDEGSERDIVENRGGESTLGNLVAEAQRWATEDETFGSAEIAFMNPGGLRANMAGPTVTYRQAANVQPFANTLVNMDLTGAQIKTVLEQQWQRDAEGNVPTRPFLRLGTSKGFEYSYDPSRPEGNRITGIWLDDEPLSKTGTYSVTVNSFLASGGDNFRELANGANARDTGQIDLQAMVDFMKEFASDTPLAVDASQHSVGATITDGVLHLSSLSMTGANDPVDEQVEVFDGETSLGTAEVTTALPEDQFDEAGTASLPVSLPKDGKLHLLRVVGDATGTEITVPVLARKVKAVMALGVRPAKVVVNRTKPRVAVVVVAGGKGATGRVQVKVNGKTRTVKLHKGRAVVKLGKFAKTGKKTVRVKYLGNATTTTATGKVTFRVVKNKKK